MPCFSTITRTTMEHGDRLKQALAALGYVVTGNGTTIVTGTKGGSLTFTRYREGQPFVTTETDTNKIDEISRKYSEIAVREFAAKNKFAVMAFENGRMTLVNRGE